MQLLHQVLFFDRFLMIEMLQQDILQFTDPLRLLLQNPIIKKLADLEADLRVFIRKERSDPGFGRPERLSSKPLFLIGIQVHMVAHDNLRPV